MPIQALSLGRLTDKSRIELFKRIFIGHGVMRIPDQKKEFSEHERMLVVPLIFGLMPRAALIRKGTDGLIKPKIRAYLDSLGLDKSDEELVTIIKEICDQFFLSAKPEPKRRKKTIADLRMYDATTYQELRKEQNYRCAICGIKLADTDEHLDHKIPFRILGDIPGGFNWQILCRECNIGKSSWFSALQPIYSENWVYDRLRLNDSQIQDKELSLTTRFSVLAQRRRCEVSTCAHTAKEAHLKVLRWNELGLDIADNLIVQCDIH